MKLPTLLLVLALATPEVTAAQRSGPAATAEEATQVYIAALGRGDWDEIAGMMHPEALAEFRVLFAPVMNGERGREIGPQVFGVPDSTGFAAASDSSLFAHFLRASMGADPALAAVMRSAKVLVLGHINEGAEVQHVVSRLTMTAEGLEFSRMDVMSLRRYQGSWRGLLTGDVRLLAQTLQAGEVVIRTALGVLTLGAALVAAPLAAQRSLAPLGTTPCAPAEVAARPSRDLYCIELISAVADSAQGTAELNWPGGPFTVAVGPDGTHRWRLTLALAGLPASMLVGSRAGFVAWVSPPSLDRFIRLGVVKNGETTLAPIVELDRFYVHVTAEADTTVDEPAGPPVLRGESAGNRLRPADNYQFFLGALDPSIGGVRPPTGAGGHAGHGASAPRDSLGWSDVPMYPGLDMLPSEMALRPAERAWRPPDDPTAPLARGREVVTLRDGDTLDLTAGVVRRSIAGRSFTMFGFNGQHPGPLLMVPRAATVTVRFKNRLPLPSTVHWHGLRLDNRSDGVPGLTQDPVPPGGGFTYTVTFPDAGIYWYHPHVREDLQQDLGLYGNIFVRGPGPEPAPVDREEFLILDDLLIGDDGLVPWGGERPTHAAMGRFGNTFLVNGEPDWRGTARPGEVVRYYLTNASNTRTYNLSFGGARMKLVGSDLGNYNDGHWVESIVIAPAERYVVDVRFNRPGIVALVNRVRALDHLYGRFFSEVDTLGRVDVRGRLRQTRAGERFAFRQSDARPMVTYDGSAAVRPYRILEARVEFTGLPFVSRRLMMLDSVYFNPVEWAGTMPGMNWATTGAQARWILRDPATGLENEAIRWRFKQGEAIRLRLVGAREVLHGMQHPIHLHGQRFLVLAVNGVPNDIQVWKDTALLPAGGTLDLLVEMTNPGRWMLHCHIAEHLQSGMTMIFDVEEE